MRGWARTFSTGCACQYVSLSHSIVGCDGSGSGISSVPNEFSPAHCPATAECQMLRELLTESRW